jgi:hypothetical protein
MINTLIRKSFTLVWLACIAAGFIACDDSSTPRILVFTKTAGFYHESIPTGVEAIQKLGKENGFEVDTTSLLKMS